jgi:hypothetical protein
MSENNVAADQAGASNRQVWQDPELIIVRIEETLSTIPPGSDGNSVGS